MNVNQNVKYSNYNNIEKENLTSRGNNPTPQNTIMQKTSKNYFSTIASQDQNNSSNIPNKYEKRLKFSY